MHKPATKTSADLLGHYEGLCQHLNAGTAPSWLTDFRQRGIDDFRRLGFPTRQHEDWRYTNVRELVSRRFVPFPAKETARATEIPQPLQTGSIQLVFRNGRLNPTASSLDNLPNGVRIQSLGSLLRDEQSPTLLDPALRVGGGGFLGLNQALAEDGAVIYVPKGIRLDRPVEMIFVVDDVDGLSMANYLSAIVLEEASAATIVERYQSVAGAGTSYFNNVATGISVAAGAELDHYKVQEESVDAFHIATTQVELQAESNFRSQYFSFGGALVRNEINCSLEGEQIECTLNGLYQAHGTQHMDQRTRIDHAMPNCNSYEVYKGILDDSSHGVFNGKIYVHPDAQKTDAKQSNQVVLLSDDAVIDTKPQLEIYADDVKCTHGATVGDLDHDALHYLKSRGIDSELARSLLTYAFANEVVQHVAVDELREYLEAIPIKDQHLDDMEVLA